MICAQLQPASPVDGTHAVVALATQPADMSSCAVVLVNSAEFSSLASNSPFNLSTAEAGQIALAVGSVWIVAWGVRMVIRVMNQFSDSTSSTDS